MQKFISEHPIKFQLATFVAIIIFAMNWSSKATSTLDEIENRISTTDNRYEHCLKWYQGLDDRMGVQEAKTQEHEVVIAEIRTKLANIEAILVDIKKTLNDE